MKHFSCKGVFMSDMRHYRIHISTSKVETIELATSTFCFKLMSYGLN